MEQLYEAADLHTKKVSKNASVEHFWMTQNGGEYRVNLSGLFLRKSSTKTFKMEVSQLNVFRGDLKDNVTGKSETKPGHC